MPLPLLPLLPLLPVPQPIPTIVPGLPAKASAPYSTIFNGGTLIVDAPGVYSTNFLVFDTPGNTIDSGGVNSTFTGFFFGPGEMNFVNSGKGGRLNLTGFTGLGGPVTINSGVNLAVNSGLFRAS